MRAGPRLADPPAPARGPQPRRGGRSRLWRWSLRAVALVLALGLLGVVAVIALWPVVPSVADAQALVRDRLVSEGSGPLGTLPVPDRVGEAVIATENSRFNHDFGIDPISLLRTGWGVLTDSPDQGAATLEVQLAKNLYEAHRAGIAAKVKEVELAFKLDARYTKGQLLLLYLNDAYFGHGFYGLAQAAAGFFGTTPDQLTWAQSSLLGGLVQAPTAYDPYAHLALAKSRQRHVLDRLVATGFLSHAAADAAYAAPLDLRPA